MKVAISGASGFVGTHLSAYLQQQGHEAVALGRPDFEDGAAGRLDQIIAQCDAVINLAGAPVDRRWTRRYRDEMWNSRIGVTRKLVGAVNRTGKVQVFISTSAVGCYPSVGCYDESAPERGTGFLARLCEAWEAEAVQVRTRCVVTRFGVVLAPDGGAFPRLARSARHGVAVVPGGGSQFFSWIALPDLVRAEEFLMLHPLDGAFNLAAPGALSMQELMHAVAAHYKARITVHVPAVAMRLAMGEAAGVLLDGQCAVPQRLRDAGFGFGVPEMSDFLRGLPI